MLAGFQSSVTLGDSIVSRVSLNAVGLEPDQTCQGFGDPKDGIDNSGASTLGDFPRHGTSTVMEAAFSKVPLVKADHSFHQIVRAMRPLQE